MSSFFQLTSESNALNISGLHPYYNYNLTVAAVTIGPGPYSVVLTIRMPEDGMDAYIPYCPVNTPPHFVHYILPKVGGAYIRGCN